MKKAIWGFAIYAKEDGKTAISRSGVSLTKDGLNDWIASWKKDYGCHDADAVFCELFEIRKVRADF